MQTVLAVVGWLAAIILGVYVFSLKRNIRALKEAIKVKDGYNESLVRKADVTVELIQTQKKQIGALEKANALLRGMGFRTRL